MQSADQKRVQEKTDKFFRGWPLLRFKSKAVILTPGQPVKGIFYLKSGLVQQAAGNFDGETLVMHVFRPGSFFYMYWLFSGEWRSGYYYQAVSDADLYLAPFADVEKFMAKNPDVVRFFAERLAIGVNGLLKRFQELAFSATKNRVASVLAYQARVLGEKSVEGIKIPISMTHREIASWIGATRETVSVEMEELTEKGLVAKKQGKVLVRDLRRLEKEAEA